MGCGSRRARAGAPPAARLRAGCRSRRRHRRARGAAAEAEDKDVVAALMGVEEIASGGLQYAPRVPEARRHHHVEEGGEAAIQARADAAVVEGALRVAGGG